MKIEIIEIDKLKAYEKNNKIHNERQIDLIAKSIKEFGFKNPVLIDKNNVIIAGHGRVQGAKKINVTEVPCIRCEDLTQTQIKAYRLADNKLADLSEYDFENIKFEIEELKLENFDVELTGFEQQEINSMFDEESTDIEEVENINMYYNFVIKCEGLKELEKLKKKLKVTSEKVNFRDISL